MTEDVYIVGIDMIRFGRFPDRTVPNLAAEAALMALDDPDASFTAGMRGTARIRVGQRTVGSWLLRLVWQTFNFRM